jgi:hypothetical protein
MVGATVEWINGIARRWASWYPLNWRIDVLKFVIWTCYVLLMC